MLIQLLKLLKNSLFLFSIIFLTSSCSFLNFSYFKNSTNDLSKNEKGLNKDKSKNFESSNKSKAMTHHENNRLDEKTLINIEKFLPYKEGKNLLSKKIQSYCSKIDRKFKKYRWGKSDCLKYNWNHVRNSVLGDPLIWVVYGDEISHKVSDKNVTLILCGTHGDEITPIKFCFDIMEHLNEHFAENPDKLVVVAPIANPDSFFKRRPTRTNARGVDVNRNFPTKDWNKDARRMWVRRYRKDKRRNPGKSSLSEPETLFQVNLIKRYRPSKILSIHSPLTILDYDGPGIVSNKKAQKLANSANQLLLQMSRKAKGYNVRNYPFFPGSLGNYAGNERSIPTYTIELPTSDPSKSAQYWKLFKEAIHSAVLHDFRDDKFVLDSKKSTSARNN